MVEGRARPSGLGNQKDRTDALQLLSIVHIGTSNLDAISPKESCSTHDFTKPFANVPDKLGSWKQYAGLISNMDHNIGRGLDALRSTGVADDTIVFSSTTTVHLSLEKAMCLTTALCMEGKDPNTRVVYGCRM